jgi:photosystem II stability/assembly factor-like uncharacterized protein
MSINLGTNDGIWELTDGGCQRFALAGKKVTHVARREGRTLATVPHDGLYFIDGTASRLIWEGDARSCAIAPDGTFFVGTEPAMIFRSQDYGANWQRSDGIDQLPTRQDWYFPPPPHQPHVRSIDFIGGQSEKVLVGVLLSEDGGDSWEERNDEVYLDVHTVRPDPSQPGSLVAVTGRGFYASEDDGRSWEFRMEGLNHRYTVGLHINPARAGELLVTPGEGPPGVNGCIYHSLNNGSSWAKLSDPILPDQYGRVPVVLFAEGAVWIATEQGQVFRAEDVSGSWALAGQVPAAIYAAAAEGSPSSIESGHR